MTTQTQPNVREEAEARFKKKEQQAHEGAKAMADYEAAALATREKTARLRSLRLAHQAAVQKRKSKAPRAGR
jgi:hypothetical protein